MSLTTVETDVKSDVAKVEGLVQEVELTFKQARKPFLLGAACGGGLILLVVITLHLVFGIL